jgi:microcompartment protein CcmK/EutM
VLVVQEGFAAMAAVNRPNSPIDMSIVGVIDSIEVHED